MTLLLIYGVLAIAFSFLCSILEAVLLTVTPTFLSAKKKEGKEYANQLERLKHDIDKPLISILTLNTIAHTVGAILVGKQAETIAREYDFQLFGLESLNFVFIVSAIMTILILVASEIIPKTIGATYWKELANFTTKTLNVLIFILKWCGILWLMRLVTKLVGSGHHEGSVLSRQDYAVMTDVVGESGELDKHDYKLIKNVLKYDELLVKDIMTPRTVMVMADENQTLKSFYDENQNLVFSRIPVYKNSKDEISGILLKDDLLTGLVEGEKDTLLSEIKREAIIILQNLTLRTAFEKLNQARSHMALVVDEYGSVLGLVTLEDIIETLFGMEIMDETDSVSDLQVYARNLWEKRAKKLGLIN